MVSTVSVVEVDAVLPAASVVTAVTTRAPWPAGVIDVVQWPVPSTVTAAVHRQRRAGIGGAADLDAASCFRALMRLSPPSIVVIATAGAVVSSVTAVPVPWRYCRRCRLPVETVMAPPPA